jgi:4-amino-4-deoxychorismate lyase
MTAAALFNGSAAGAELAWSRGLHYGDGIFRTCLIYDSDVIDLKEQLEKAEHDARHLELAAPPTALLAAEAQSLAANCPRGILRIVLMRSGGERGYRARSTAADRLLCRYQAAAHPASCWEQGVRAQRSRWRLATQPALAGIKHLNRLEQVLASRSWSDGIDEVILDDADGRPVSGSRSNLFWVQDGTLRTPSLERCGVAGLMRDKVLAAAAALGVATRIAAGTWAELENAGEAFVTNSVIGIWPLASLDERRWRAPGPVTRRLSERLRHPRVAA